MPASVRSVRVACAAPHAVNLCLELCELFMEEGGSGETAERAL